jgi:hypothetical protein
MAVVKMTEVKVEMLRIRWLALILAVVLTLGAIQGYPLRGGNGKVDCIIFGAFKTQFIPGDVNAGKNVIFDVDAGLIRFNSTGAKVDNPPDNSSKNSTNSTSSAKLYSADDEIRATYILVDGNDRIYPLRLEYTKDTQHDRHILGFVVPKEAVAKSLIVDPSSDPAGGDRFAIEFGPIANASNANATILYYGTTSTKIDSNRKSVRFDVGIANNGTCELPVSTSNFSLIDQWGWMYSCKAYNQYNNNDGFANRSLRPNETLRTGVSFASLSVLSRPSKLVYEYSKNNSLIIDIDKEEGSAGSSLSNGCGECDKGSSGPASTSLAGDIKATKSRLAKVRQSL